MSEYLPKEVREGLAAVRGDATHRMSRRRVRVGEREFTILRHWEGGFALDREEASGLRGLVDVYDGVRHHSRCLIVSSESSGGEAVFEYKRCTPVAEGPALDYERATPVPRGLLSRPAS